MKTAFQAALGGLLVLVLAGPPLCAQDAIGWNYQGVGGVGLAPTDTAGAPGFEQANWNNHAGSGQDVGTVPLEDLLDSAGNASTADVTSWSLSTANSWQHGQTASPDEILMNDFNDKEPSLTFEGIPFTGNGYTVVVYYGNNEGPSASMLSVGALTRAITTGNTAQSSFGVNGYLEGTDSNGGTPTNYAVFEGLTGATLTISLSGANNNGISAIQFIANQSTDAPVTPTGPSPAHQATDIAVDGILDWADSLRADEYDVFLWPSAELEPGVANATVTTSDYDPPATLLESTEYSWRIVARNTASSLSASGPVWTFTTGINLPPDAPANPAPAIAVTGVDPTVNLNWGDAALAASYNVYLWIPPAVKPASPTAMTNLSVYDPPADLAQGTEYYWTVEAVNGSGTTPAVEEFWSFTTLAPPANAPMNPSPANLATGISPVTALDWDDVANAASYHVRLWRATDSRPAAPTATVTASMYQPASVLMFSSDYLWDVEAVNALGMTSGGPWAFGTAGSVLEAKKIGWNMQGVGGVGLAPDAVAGAPGFAQAQWNNHPSNGQGPGATPLSDLGDSTGAGTTADVVSWSQATNNGWEHMQTATPDEILMNDFADTEPAIVFGEIPYPRYDVVVYYGNNEGPSVSTLSVGEVARTITTGNTALSTVRAVGYVEGTDANGDVPTNYAVFTGLSGPDLSVSLAGLNNNGISAIQIVEGTGGPPFVITAFAMTEAGPVLTFNTIPGTFYAIDRSTDLVFWGELNDSYPAGGASGDSESFTDEAFLTDYPDDLPPAVYYRVRALP